MKISVSASSSWETAERVWTSGAPYVDSIVRGAYPSPRQALETIGLANIGEYFVVLQHPDTYRPEKSYDHATAILSVMAERNEDKIVIYPCSDPGFAGVIRAIDGLAGKPNFHVFKNIESVVFLGLLGGARALVGNSSAGVIEAPYFGLPFVNVGSRQDGRETADNVISCDGTPASIKGALQKLDDPGFRNALAADNRPFGDGYASERIFEVLKTVPLGPALFRKRITY